MKTNNFNPGDKVIVTSETPGTRASQIGFVTEVRIDWAGGMEYPLPTILVEFRDCRGDAGWSYTKTLPFDPSELILLDEAGMLLYV